MTSRHADIVPAAPSPADLSTSQQTSPPGHWQAGEDGCMPTPEENIQSVRTFAEEVFGNKNLKYAADWLADDFVEHQVFQGTTPDKKGAIDSYRIFIAASPDTTAEIHDMIAASDKVAIRATDEGGFIPKMPATGKAFEMEAMYLVRVNDEGQIAKHWVSSTPSERWDSSACFRPHRDRPLPW
jgi:predicted ester cyclase